MRLAYLVDVKNINARTFKLSKYKDFQTVDELIDFLYSKNWSSIQFSWIILIIQMCTIFKHLLCSLLLIISRWNPFTVFRRKFWSILMYSAHRMLYSRYCFAILKSSEVSGNSISGFDKRMAFIVETSIILLRSFHYTKEAQIIR